MRFLKITAFTAALVAGVTPGAADERAEPKGAGEQVTCAGGGIDVTVALAYDRVTVGELSATYLSVGFEAPVALPHEMPKVRARLTSLEPATKLARPSVVGKRLRVALISTERGFGPGDALKIRFDCPSGSRVAASDFSCATSEVANAAGEPLAEGLAREVRCLVEPRPAAR